MKSISILIFLGFIGIVPALASPVLPIESAPVSLDWNGESSLAEAPLILNLHEGLFTYGAKGNLRESQAESVSKNKSNTEYTFKIKKNISWSDGKPLVAQQFIDAWKRLLSPESSSIYSYVLFDVKNAEAFHKKEIDSFESVGIKRIDDFTIKVSLNRPNPMFEQITAFWPLFAIRKDLIEKYGTTWWKPGVLVGTGPYLFESFENNRLITLKKNKYYSPGKFKGPEQVQFQVVSNTEEAKDLFAKGKLDLYLAHEQTKKSVLIPSYRTYLIGANTAKFPLNSLFMRKAIFKLQLGAGAKNMKLNHLLPAKRFSQSLKNKNTSPSTPSASVADAQVLLKESGLTFGKALKLKILTSSSEPSLTLARALQEQIESKLGIPADVDPHNNQDFNTHASLGNFDLIVLTWTPKIPGEEDALLPYSARAKFNRVQYKSPNYDKLIESGKFFEAETLICKTDAVICPVFIERTYSEMQPSLKGLIFHPTGAPLLRELNHP